MAGAIPWQQLTILLTVAIASHFAFRRFQLPTIIGEICIGIVLGQILGAGFWDPSFTGTFAALGAIVLLFVIGLESEVKSIYTKRNIAVAAGGIILPWIGGFLLAELMLPAETFASKVFIGAIMVATSTAITAAVLLEMNALRTEVARTIIGAAVVDDILGLIVLSLSNSIASDTLNAVNLILLVGIALLFIGIGLFIGVRYFTRLVIWAEDWGRRYNFKHTGFVLALGLTFLYASVANMVQLHPIVGAFLAGAILSKSRLNSDLQQGAEYIGAIFTPLFFVSLGLQVELLSVDTGLIAFGVALIAVAILTKVIGCWIPARLFGLSKGESLAVGLGMAPRGEVGLIIASAALISRPLYSVMVLATIMTTIIPPPFFKRCLRNCIKVDLEKRLSAMEQQA